MTVRRRGTAAALVLALLLLGGAGIYFAVQHGAPDRAAPAIATGAPSSTSASAAPRAPARTRELPPLRLSEASASPDAAVFGVLEGRVLSTVGGGPVPRAALAFQHQGRDTTVVADESGAFRLVAWQSGRYDLVWLAAIGYLPFASPTNHSAIATFEARPGVRVSGVTLYLTPAVEYRGVVLDPASKPVAGAEVVRAEPLGEERTRFTTDARGEFTFHALDGTVFEARHAGFAAARARVDLAVQVSKRLTLRLRPGSSEPAHASISGLVVDAHGAPVGDALVLADAEDDSDGPAAQARATTDLAGRFMLAHLDRGAYTVTAYEYGLAPARAEHVPAGASDVRLVLRDGGTLRGTVRDASGPIAAFTILMSERHGALERGDYRAESFVDAEGRYQVRGLAPGAWAITAVAHGHARAAEQLVEVASDHDATIDFTLGHGGRVTGQVIDAQTHAPIPAARVSLEGAPDADSPLPIFVATNSDAGGRFTLAGLEPGLRTIQAAADAHHTRLLSALRVESNGDLGPLTIELTPTEPGEEPRIELAGIAAVLKAEADALIIAQVMPAGGAQSAGLLSGDRILAVDDTSVSDLGFSGAIEHIRGPEGTTVLLRIQRADKPPTDIPVQRKRVISAPHG